MHGIRKNQLNLIELSDAFRRSAAEIWSPTVQLLVKEARKFAVASTHYHGEYPRLGMNKDVDDALRAHACRIAALAERLNVSTVVLPHTGDKASWNARRIEREVIARLDLPVRLVLQNREYSRDLSDVGPIDRRKKTALDLGIRGVMDIDQGVRARWDRAPRP